MVESVFLREFTNITRKSDVTDNPSRLTENSTDATRIKAKPILVIWPNNTQQVLDIVKLANRKHLTIVPRGGGSGLCGGATANNSIVVNLTKMNKVIKIDKKNKYVVVQPGMFLDKLNEILDKYDLSFPVKPASHKIATLGGMIATNAGGEHVLRFGKMLENILEMEVVTGDGELIKVGKNKLKHFCGTEGLMGIIVEAKLKLLPKIKTTSITIHEVGTIGTLMKLVKKSTKSNDLIACEFINPKIYKMGGFGKRYFVLLEYKGKKGMITNTKQIKKFWKIRENCFYLMFKHGWKIIADPKLPLENLSKFLFWCERNNLPAFGHIGHGIVHVHFNNIRKMEEMYRLVEKLHGEISGEHGFGIIKKIYLSNKRRVELKKLKQIYDSNNILNPGKVI